MNLRRRAVSRLPWNPATFRQDRHSGFPWPEVYFGGDRQSKAHVEGNRRDFVAHIHLDPGPVSDCSRPGVTLSNADLAFMKLGSSDVVDGVSRLGTAAPQISVLAGGQVDGPRLGIPAQGGESWFLQRFGLRTHARFRAVESMRFAPSTRIRCAREG